MASLNLCYATDGQLATDNIPCDPNVETSACCGTGSVCVSNLYCVDPSGDNVPGTCTDQEWGSFPDPACPCNPRYVVGAPLNYLDSVTFCSDGSVCCGYGNTECCNAGQGHAQIIYGQTAVIPSSTGAALSSYYSGVHVSTDPITRATSTPSSQTSVSQVNQASSLTTRTSSGSSTTYASPSSNVSVTLSHSVSGLSQGAKIGLGVGAVVGAFLLIAITVALTCLYVKRKHRNAQHEKVAPREVDQQPPYELPRNTWSRARPELDGIPRATEMHAE